MLWLWETVLSPGRPSGALGGGKLEGSREACEAGGAWEDCRLLWDSRAFLSFLVPSFVPMCHQRTAATILIKDSLSGSLGRREGESGRGGSGQERVTPPLGLALPPPLALGRKHLCPMDTHILS